MRNDKPWCGRPLPDDRDGWKTRAFAFKDALLETRSELAACQTERAAALERAEAYRAALEKYAKHDSWFQTEHRRADFHDFPITVWAWDRSNHPWAFAEEALAAALPDSVRAE